MHVVLPDGKLKLPMANITTVSDCAAHVTMVLEVWFGARTKHEVRSKSF